MRKIFFIITLVLVYVGGYLTASIFERAEYYELIDDVELQRIPGVLGSVPAGSIVRLEEELPETTVYSVRFSLKEKNIVSHREYYKGIGVNLYGYPKE